MDQLEVQHTNQNKKRKKKKEYYIRANPLPRILKRDIRREYAKMFLNVHNYFDSNLVGEFFREVCTPDCHFRISVPIIATQFNGPDIRYFNGINNIIGNTLHCFDLIPDKIVKMREIPEHSQRHSSHPTAKSSMEDAVIASKKAHVQIIQREKVPGCEIKFFTEVHSTIMYADPFHYYTPVSSVPSSSCSRSQTRSPSSPSSSSMSSLKTTLSSLYTTDHTNHTAYQAGLEHNGCMICRDMRRNLICPPIALTCYSKVTLLLNEQHRIYSIAIDAD